MSPMEDAIAPPPERSPADYAIEHGRYLATAAEHFMAEQNRAAEAGEDPDPDFWRGLESAIYEFRKRADRVPVPVAFLTGSPGEQARALVARWEHGDEAHRQWLRDVAIPDLIAVLAPIAPPPDPRIAAAEQRVVDAAMRLAPCFVLLDRADLETKLVFSPLYNTVMELLHLRAERDRSAE